jgi:hypothetical protein
MATLEVLGADRQSSGLRHSPGPGRPFSYHRHEVPILIVFMCIALIELPLAHLLISLWSVQVAWVLSALTSAVLIHVALLIRAMVLRPIMVDDRGVTLRCGLATELFLPLGILATLDSGSAPEPKGRSVLRTTLLAPPNLTLRLAEPVLLRRVASERLIDRIVLRLDEPEAFRADLEARRESAAALTT